MFDPNKDKIELNNEILKGIYDNIISENKKAGEILNKRVKIKNPATKEEADKLVDCYMPYDVTQIKNDKIEHGKIFVEKEGKVSQICEEKK